MLLIVDSDPTFLNDAEQLLNQDGGVFLALNADHARFLVGSVGDDLSVALVDSDLPGLNDLSLIREMRRDFPHLPVIAISVANKDDIPPSPKTFGAAGALKKPITPMWNATIARVRATTEKWRRFASFPRGSAKPA